MHHSNSNPLAKILISDFSESEISMVNIRGATNVSNGVMINGTFFLFHVIISASESFLAQFLLLSHFQEKTIFRWQNKSERKLRYEKSENI